MATSPQLNFNDRKELVTALLACDCIQDLNARNLVFAQLRPEISQKIKRFPDNHLDVTSVVTICLEFAGGFAELLNIVEFYEGNTFARQQLIEVKERIFNQSTDLLDKLGRQLASSLPAHNPAIEPLQRTQVKEQIEEFKRKRGQTGLPGERGSYLDEVMHEINFTELQDFLDQGDRQARQDGFASLCLVQQSEALGGEWCLKRIQDRLHRKRDEEPNEVHIRPIEGETPDAHFILKRLSAKFDVAHPAEDLTGHTQAIIQKICGSLYIGGRLLVVIRQWEDFANHAATLNWFLHDFWRPLVQAFRQHENRLRARLIVVIMADPPILGPDQADHCCELADFHEQKIVHLRLRPWTRMELEEWLEEYYGKGHTLEKLKRYAQTIYESSNGGLPPLIYNQAVKRLLREAN